MVNFSVDTVPNTGFYGPGATTDLVFVGGSTGEDNSISLNGTTNYGYVENDGTLDSIDQYINYGIVMDWGAFTPKSYGCLMSKLPGWEIVSNDTQKKVLVSHVDTAFYTPADAMPVGKTLITVTRNPETQMVGLWYNGDFIGETPITVYDAADGGHQLKIGAEGDTASAFQNLIFYAGFFYKGPLSSDQIASICTHYSITP